MLAVEPMRFIYRGRIAVFSIKVLRDERVCVVAEQRPDCSEEESFQVRTEPSDLSKAQIKSSDWLTHPAIGLGEDGFAQYKWGGGSGEAQGCDCLRPEREASRGSTYARVTGARRRGGNSCGRGATFDKIPSF